MQTQCARLAPPLVALRFLASFSALSSLLPATRAAAEPVHVRLRGAVRIDAQGVRGDGGDLIVRGVLTDDAGALLSDAPLTVSLAHSSARAAPLVLAGSSAVRSCAAGPDARPPHLFTDGIHLVTDGGGRFCVRVGLPIDRYAAHIAYAGAGYIDGGANDVEVDLSRRTATVAFAPPPRVIPLDAKAISLEATATLEGDAANAVGAGFPLTLLTEPEGSPVATATTDITGHAHFTVQPSRLGPPGRGTLRLAFAGNADAAPASRVVAVERRTQVELDVPGAEAGKLAAGSPEDGVSFVVTARAAGGAVTSGSVEARVGEAIVGAAPIEQGSAKVLVTFAPPESAGASGEVGITLRYVASAPWFEPGAESVWKLPVRARSPLRQAWALLGALAVAAWFALTRAQRARAMAKPVARPPRPAPRGEAKLDVVRVARDPAEGWQGRVTDADDASPIGAARVQIERPAFGRAEVLGRAVTDEEGHFELRGVETRPGDELAIEASLHVPLRRPLPHASELDAQLVLRKRALLGRLVAWAKLRGRPFDARPEPTPGHVRRAAGDDFRIARWADAVERAAFAGEPVDAHVEAEVDRLGPGPAAPAPDPSPVMDRRALANPTKANR